MIDTFLLIIIVMIGLGEVFFEYDTWRMNKERYDERRKWREEKRKQGSSSGCTSTELTCSAGIQMYGQYTHTNDAFKGNKFTYSYPSIQCLIRMGNNQEPTYQDMVMST